MNANQTKKERVAILGASSHPERYSYKAMKLLEQYGHEVFLVHPREKEIEGHIVYPTLDQVPRPIDTVTVYVNPELAIKMKDQILNCRANRVIFNPGTECDEIEAEVKSYGGLPEQACTLVLLRTNQF